MLLSLLSNLLQALYLLHANLEPPAAFCSVCLHACCPLAASLPLPAV
jgi:hypothetical protein